VRLGDTAIPMPRIWEEGTLSARRRALASLAKSEVASVARFNVTLLQMLQEGVFKSDDIQDCRSSNSLILVISSICPLNRSDVDHSCSPYRLGHQIKWDAKFALDGRYSIC
jgi:hypothetical protein